MFGIAKSEYVDPYSPPLFVQTLVGIGACTDIGGYWCLYRHWWVLVLVQTLVGIGAVQTHGMGSALLDLAALLLSLAF